MTASALTLRNQTWKNHPLVPSWADLKKVGLDEFYTRAKIANHLNNVDWKKYSNLAAHDCRHISMYHIRRALIDGGFRD